ncbi:hypothetical protein GLOIN_2v1771732 [Rhizophagus clarus]|uniref:Uncharacterized protein n=1 Tax=Rhizophagus clarus TaxID=94130 RepID=A0A8H3QSL5_9GLOM|nr:hypothetical protein GLOIN_2v1771732 [Rhizophagus clarus]
MVVFSRPIFFPSLSPFERNPTPFLHIITNDKKASLTESVYQSTSKYLNKKFKVSLLLSHFFKLQKVIPKRIQHKYFTFLRDSLYKRLSIIESRFILGIYIPCCYPGTFLSSSPDLKDNTCCTLPTSIVYSRFNNFCRVGCGLHYKQVPEYSKPLKTPSITSSEQRTAALVNIHQKWSSQSINHVYSTRRVSTFNRHVNHLRKGVHDKRPHLTQYLPIIKPVPVIVDMRITRANRDQIEYIPLPEDVCSSMSHDDYMKYKDFFPLRPVFLGKGKRHFALTPGSDKKSKKTPVWRCLEHWRLLTDQTLDGNSYPGSSVRYFDTLKPDSNEYDHTYDSNEFRLKRPYHSPLYIDHHYHLVRTSKRPCFNFDHVITK